MRPEVIFQVSTDSVRRKRRKAALWGGSLLALVVVAATWGALDVVSGIRDARIFIPVLLGGAGAALILVEGLARNPFGIATTGLFPPRRPYSKMLSRQDWFLPFGDIRHIEASEPADSPNSEGRPFQFRLELREGGGVSISPIGGLGALARYIKTEREMMKAYRLLRIVMEEINQPAARVRAERGEDITIPREKLQAALR